MTTLVATSVVRGSQQGESHGGIYLVNLDDGEIKQVVDWNTMDIDWQGRGWDRGLRGIAFDGERVYVAASDELFVFDREFQVLASYRSPYLAHCHEISCFKRRLYLSSTGFDSLLGFDLDRHHFSWGLHIAAGNDGYTAAAFDPSGTHGPEAVNNFHINNVFAQESGLYFSGLRTRGLLKFDGRRVRKTVILPRGVHNARPFDGGVLFNDSEADAVRFVTPERQVRFAVPRYDIDALTHTDFADKRLARQGFGRGLCVLGPKQIAAGSSPSTIAVHDLELGTTTATHTITRDIRNAIHGLEIWPYQ
ncbi:MAG TPA: hypothetical protein PKK10_10125 [Woeseiaceae bacterium]|nr:hypothetical protein [Woeseiaceae bacterium]